MITVSLKLQIDDIKSLIAENGFVLWQVPEGFDFAGVESELSDISLIHASEGFLNLNLGISKSNKLKALIILEGAVEADDPLAVSLRARFIEYRTTVEAQILKELAWPGYFENWIKEHPSLFADKNSLSKMKKIEIAGLTIQTLSESVLLRLFGVDERSSVGFALALLSGDPSEIEETLALINYSSLDALLWTKLSNEVGYSSAQPGVEDLRVWLAQTTIASALSDLDRTRTSSGSGTSVEYFLQELKLRHPAAYVSFCESEVAALADMSQVRELEPLMLSRVHHLPQVDSTLFDKCLRDLVAPNSGLTSDAVQNLLRNREKSVWVKKFRDGFEAILHGTKILEQVKSLDLHCSDFSSGVTSYVRSWHEVDMAYRKFVLASKGITDINSDFGVLAELVEAAYVNAFQNKLGENWQLVLSGLDSWVRLPGVTFAREFFKEHILLPLSSEKNRIAVIISDALRYEVGVEASQLLSGSGFDVKVSSLIAPLPSYTQLGMAALLPNKQISLKPDSKTVLVDGESSAGLENRKKILAGSNGSAIDFESFITENDLKGRLAEFRLWYVYHNKIDKVGDSAASEGSVFDAVENTFEELKLAVQKLKAAGFNKIFITADHGFLYQDSSIAEHGFLSTVPEGEVTEFINRRFVIGNGLQESEGLKLFTSSQLGYECDYEIQIPASTLRLRRRGSGLRFVHGGASLQEIVVPLLELTKSSQKVSAQVDVVLSPGVSKRITTGLVALSFTQKDPVSETLLGRDLRVAIFSGDQRISTTENVTFAHTDLEIRNRVTTLSLNMTNDLSKSGQKSVVLKLESRIGQTERWGPYAEIDFELANLAEKDF